LDKKYMSARICLTTWGVSGSDKTDETNSPNRRSIWTCLVRFRTKPNQFETTLFGSVLVFHFEIQETDGNSTLHFTNIIPPQTLIIRSKIKAQHKILLNLFTFSHHHHHLISSLRLYFISTKKETISVNYT